MEIFQKRSRGIAPYILVLPLFLMLVGTYVFPFFYNIYISFTNFSLAKINFDFVGLENYKMILSDPLTWKAISRTIAYTTINVSLITTGGIIIAFLMIQKMPGSSILKVFLVIPWIVPEVVTGYVWRWMLISDYGIINHVLKSIGIIDSTFSWFTNPVRGFSAILLANTWRGLPFISLLVYARLSTLPRDHLDASKVDGANKLLTFKAVIYPYIEPVVKRAVLLAYFWTFNSFALIFTMTGGGPMNMTTTIPVLIQRTAFHYFRMGEGATQAVITLLILLLTYLLVKPFLFNTEESGL